MSDGSELFDEAIRVFREGFEGGSVDQKRAELKLLFADLANSADDPKLEHLLHRAQSTLYPKREEPLPLEAALKAVAS